MSRRGRPCSVCTSPHGTSVALDVTRGETLSSIANHMAEEAPEELAKALLPFLAERRSDEPSS